MSDVRFFTCGSSGTQLPGVIIRRALPLFDTAVGSAKTGAEYRVSEADARHRFVAQCKLRSWLNEDRDFIEFFKARGGKRDSFLIRDPSGNAVTAHGFGVGDGSTTAFQLQRTLGGTVTDVTGSWTTATTPRTNLLLRSQEFDNASWKKVDTGVDTTVVTANYGVAPDGTLTADRVQFPGNASLAQNAPAGSWTTGQGLTFSIWVNGAAGKKVLIANSWLEGGTDWAQTLFTLTGAWQRIYVTATATGSRVNPYPLIASGFGGADAPEVMAWGAQLETGSTSTRYIPTTSAVVTASPSYWPDLGDGFEPVYDPVWSGVTIYKDGAAVTPSSGFTIGAHGQVVFASAPASGAVLTWTGSYYHRVRFDADSLADSFDWDGPVLRGSIEMVTVSG